jgi:nicotinic acid mononucleotide adenylyltransferase
LTLENIDNYLLADLPDLIEISSTVVRNMLSVKKNVNAIITAEISEYIQNNNISYM